MPRQQIIGLRLLSALVLFLSGFTPAPVHAAAPHESGRTPIVLIPGLMGSRLFNNPDNGPEEEVWADVSKLSDLFGENPLLVLGLAPDGVSPAEDDPAYTTVHTQPGTPGLLTRLTGYGWGVYVDEDFYDTIVRHFTEGHGYAEDIDFWVYPYDWRKDLRSSADGLDTLIQSIHAQTGAAQVQIVAHSLGGLLTRQYLSDPARAARVEQAVLLGTPFVGTPKAFYVLQEGDCLVEINLILFTICLPEASAIREVVPNYPAFYQLMPSEAYFALKGGGFYGLGRDVNVGGTCPIPTCLSHADTYTAERAPDINQPLSDDARQFHLPLDALTDWGGVPVTLIGGKNYQTMVGIREYEAWSWLCFCYETVREPVESPAGDGTVTLLSVRLANPSRGGLNLRGTATFRVFAMDHLGLVKDPAVLAYVDSVLGLPSLMPQPGQALAFEVADAVGVQIIASGVAALHAYDDRGRHTGPVAGTDLVAKAIPGSDYFARAGRASLALIGGRNYTITVEPGGQEPVDISLIRSLGDETLTTLHYQGLNLTPQSRLQLVGDPSLADTWQLDADGRGVNLQALTPTAAISADAPDTTPPTLTVGVEGKLGPRGRYVGPVTITLSGADDTGVGRIEYAFSRDRQVRVYTGPFVVSPDEVGALYAVAVDVAGNQSRASVTRLGRKR